MQAYELLLRGSPVLPLFFCLFTLEMGKICIATWKKMPAITAQLKEEF